MDWACWRAGRRWALGWVRRQGRWACWRWGAGLGVQARRQQALGRAGTARACANGRGARRRARRARQAERAAGWASGSSAQGARQAGRAAAGRAGCAGRAGDGRQARGQAWRGRAGARGWARTVRAGHGRPGRGLGAGGWQTGPAGPVLVHYAPGSVLARFLDPVRLGIFLSHQMNIVHYKIKFFRKKNNIY